MTGVVATEDDGTTELTVTGVSAGEGRFKRGVTIGPETEEIESAGDSFSLASVGEADTDTGADEEGFMAGDGVGTDNVCVRVAAACCCCCCCCW